jgi:hypothetical protein
MDSSLTRGTSTYEEPEDKTLYSSRRQARNAYIAQSQLPSTRELAPEEQEDYLDEDEYAEQPAEYYEDDQWRDVDPDMGYEYEDPDPLDVRMGYAPVPAPRAGYVPAAKRTRQLDESRAHREYDGYEEEYTDDQPVARPRRKPRSAGRRRLLFGLGATAVGAVAAYEIVPKIPQAIGGAASDVEKQLQDAFNKGLAQGADNARREIIGALENLDGFTIDGAIGAAKLLRVAYDVFVAPIIVQSANITGNILTAMLQAVKTARGILAQTFMDNSTLVAVQKVLQGWVDQVSTLPKQLNAITDTDLEGAQAYLTALKQKVNDEKAKLNNPATPTPTSTKR